MSSLDCRSDHGHGAFCLACLEAGKGKKATQLIEAAYREVHLGGWTIVQCFTLSLGTFTAASQKQSGQGNSGNMSVTSDWHL